MKGEAKIREARVQADDRSLERIGATYLGWPEKSGDRTVCAMISSRASRRRSFNGSLKYRGNESFSSDILFPAVSVRGAA